MILFIDTTNQDLVRLVLFSAKQKFEHHFANANLSENIISEIKNFCKKNSIKLSQLEKIMVVRGPGSFSKIRTAVAVANSLAFGLGILVVGIRSSEAENFEKQEGLKGKKMTIPLYDKKPNITRPKSI
jgi:tRNA threonylcarbamoyladenosine biosynthesis protein TsaB